MRIGSGKTGVKSKVRSVHPHQEFQGVPRPRDHGPEAEVGTESICNFCGGLKPLDINTGRSICVILTKVWKISDNLLLACVASVSNRVTARKLEREQKKKKVEGGGGVEKRKPSFLHSFIPSFPSPSPVLSFFLLSSQLSRRTREDTLATQANHLQKHIPLSPFPNFLIGLGLRAMRVSSLSSARFFQ